MTFYIFSIYLFKSSMGEARSRLVRRSSDLNAVDAEQKSKQNQCLALWPPHSTTTFTTKIRPVRLITSASGSSPPLETVTTCTRSRISRSPGCGAHFQENWGFLYLSHYRSTDSVSKKEWKMWELTGLSLPYIDTLASKPWQICNFATKQSYHDINLPSFILESEATLALDSFYFSLIFILA